MEKIRGNVDTSFYLRHVFSYQLRNIEDGTVILYYTNHGSPWINRLAEAEEWLSEEETKRLDHDKIERPSTKSEFVSFFNIDLKVVIDRQPLLGAGSLPDWLRNLAHGGAMATLVTHKDNLFLWPGRAKLGKSTLIHREPKQKATRTRSCTISRRMAIIIIGRKRRPRSR